MQFEDTTFMICDIHIRYTLRTGNQILLFVFDKTHFFFFIYTICFVVSLINMGVCNMNNLKE